MNRRVLVTGATGFVGSHVAEEFLRNGWKVRVLVRSPNKLRNFPLDEVEIAPGSLTDIDSMKKAIRNCDVIVHCAALTSAFHARDFHHINAEMTGELVKIARAEVKRFVYCSSQAAAGPSPHDQPVSEADPPHPITAYGMSKLGGERYLQEHCDDMEWLILRPSAVIGPRDEQFLPLFKAVVRFGVYPSFGTGEQRYSFVCVHDLARALCLAAETDRGVRDTYFVAHPESTRWSDASRIIAEFAHRRVRELRLGSFVLQVVSLVAEFSGRLSRRPPLLSRDKISEILASGWVCSGTRICTVLGFNYFCSLERTLREAYEYYHSHAML